MSFHFVDLVRTLLDMTIDDVTRWAPALLQFGSSENLAVLRDLRLLGRRLCLRVETEQVVEPLKNPAGRGCSVRSILLGTCHSWLAFVSFELVGKFKSCVTKPTTFLHLYSQILTTLILAS